LKGSIKFESELNIWTTFYIKLPLQDENNSFNWG
jgi:signal transduction histidine kinase